MSARSAFNQIWGLVLSSVRPSDESAIADNAVPLIGSFEDGINLSKTLRLLMPDEQMVIRCHDDYYPTILFAIQDQPNFPLFRDAIETMLNEMRHIMSAKVRTEVCTAVEKLFNDNTDLLSCLKQIAKAPAKFFPHMASRINSSPDDPLYYDLKTNTRYGRFYHNQGVEDLFGLIEKLEVKNGIFIDPFAKNQQTLVERPVLALN